MKKIILLFFITLSFAKTIVVDDDFFCMPFFGCMGGCDNGTYETTTIEDALNHSVNGDIIKICPGNYNESDLIVDKNIKIISTHTMHINDINVTDNSNNPIETKAYPTPAKRPHYSLLNRSKIKDKFNITIPYWKDSLDKCLVKMGERR